MRIRVLGSAAGGGFPQWNCGCANCCGARDGRIRATPRTQESVAISADDHRWFLLNASPEIRAQIESFAPLWPQSRRHTPIAGIALTNGDLDHCLGLFSLRESQPLTVYTTRAIWRGLSEGNAIFKTLDRFPDQVRFVELPLGREVKLHEGLSLTAVPAPGKRPLHLTGEASAEDNVGLVIREKGRSLAYFPAVARLDPAVERALSAADVVFFDGTFYTSDELIAQELGTKRAEDMAHWPVGGERGSMHHLAALRAERRILIHLNNTNPLLREDSEERRAVESRKIEIAFDRMELSL